MKKILYYNWVPFDDDENRGGGVTVYQKNLIEELIKENKYEIYFLCSGLSYNFSRKHAFIEKYSNCFGNKCHSYRIVNSPVLSPAYYNFKNVQKYLTDRTLLKIFDEFFEKNGPFDIIHFNNFEGLSLSVFELKKKYPQTKFVYSLHNYYSFCPQVNLWKNESENCQNNHDGKDCVNCVITNFHFQDVIRADMIAYYLRRVGFDSKTKVWDKTFKLCRLLGKIKHKLFSKTPSVLVSKNKSLWKNLGIDDEKICKEAALYDNFIRQSKESINQYVDVVLAVSQRVKEIAIARGINPNKVVTSYIGTKFAQKQLGHSRTIYDGNVLNVIYMGYARRDKGFFFYLDCLEMIPDSIAKKISLYFAVRTDDIYLLNRMRSLREKFGGVYFKNGYKHDEIEKMLQAIHLGIVPVLWEDNLPQVAIELNAEGIPVLSSDLGGASELSSSKYFRFKGGNKADFVDKLTNIIKNKMIINDYWEKRMILKKMENHVAELSSFYQE